jgi:cytochrome c5
MFKPTLFLSIIPAVLLLAPSVALLDFAAPTPQTAPATAPATVAAPILPNPVTPTAASQARAKGIYARDCAMCHNTNGDGKTDLGSVLKITSNWTDPKSLAARQDGELFNTIRNGAGNMPAEDPARAKDDDVWNLVIYIRGMSKQ